MPELPEVETVVRTLEQQIKDREILQVNIRYGKTVEGERDAFCRALLHQHFRTFSRRGKYLLFGMDSCILCVHLRMEGKFYIQSPQEPVNRHMHVIFTMDDGKELRFHDTRKFGRMEILPYDTDLKQFKGLGPEPFDEAFNADYLHAARKGRSMPLKSFLLDQSVVAGIGNIYANEILYACGLRPGRSCKRITRRNEEDIVYHTRRILNEAIAAGGTTIRSYTSSLGVTGLFQLSCKVYGQKVCSSCGGEIHVKKIGGRGSYYCPQCQK